MTLQSTDATRGVATAAPRVAIVGGGMVGLAHAWAAAKRGCQVIVFERDPRASGASVRNFGMVWPIGQANGPNHRTALASRTLWLEFLRESGLWHRSSGSLHLAYRDDELAVLEEFSRLASSVGYDCRLLSPSEAAMRSPAVRTECLRGALWSPTELGVDPRQVVAEMPRWLQQRYGVQFRFGVAIDRVARWSVGANDGSRWSVDRVVVAAGADVRFLFPGLYRQAGFKLCKLQMMRTVAQPGDWKLGPMIAGGLTLRHYDSFAICRSLGRVKARIADQTPELDRFGVHVLAAQNEAGELIFGDSHEYADEVSPYDETAIDDLILRELRELIDVPDWTIRQRWHGVYAKANECVEYVHEPEKNVHVVVPSGGCGMTMSFGQAEKHWSAWEPVGEACAKARRCG